MNFPTSQFPKYSPCHIAGIRSQGGDMQREAPEQEEQAQHGDQQGAQTEAGGGEPLQSHHRHQDPGDRLSGAEVRQLQPAAAEGAAGGAEQ